MRLTERQREDLLQCDDHGLFDWPYAKGRAALDRLVNKGLLRKDVSGFYQMTDAGRAAREGRT